MRVVKVNTISYDPQSRTLTFSGLNRFSRRKQAAIQIDDDVQFIEIIHQLLARSEHSSVEVADKLESTSGKKKKKPLEKPGKTRKADNAQPEAG